MILHRKREKQRPCISAGRALFVFSGIQHMVQVFAELTAGFHEVGKNGSQHQKHCNTGKSLCPEAGREAVEEEKSPPGGSFSRQSRTTPKPCAARRRREGCRDHSLLPDIHLSIPLPAFSQGRRRKPSFS